MSILHTKQSDVNMQFEQTLFQSDSTWRINNANKFTFSQQKYQNDGLLMGRL